ncbi:hypothetical protein PPL_12468 [Heterostelium album PN500]|uniref:Uncharacterized protein n=1 Tax=Heterostelium pallidum (strain ATCC 26659 / Pp 5 / PN500) TaxID=670386 RepID=D3BMP5_HETP5|nr:hypothetical protein PPL_12468 [Heterostelium album PN500]EFA77257.1 hypothetical protein PPL_12468 [Heterostelium album PN500]|eukprot:XP_020429386.1 hypothetical protein PPL_12468 [Heterostelium album PN500]
MLTLTTQLRSATSYTDSLKNVRLCVERDEEILVLKKKRCDD